MQHEEENPIARAPYWLLAGKVVLGALSTMIALQWAGKHVDSIPLPSALLNRVLDKFIDFWYWVGFGFAQLSRIGDELTLVVEAGFEVLKPITLMSLSVFRSFFGYFDYIEQSARKNKNPLTVLGGSVLIIAVSVGVELRYRPVRAACAAALRWVREHWAPRGDGDHPEQQ